MPPSLALRVAWTVLTSTAIPAAWLVLVPFSKATGYWWGQMLFGATITVMEVMFALGMIWHMRPSDMPRSYCVAQALILQIGTFMLSGICACLALSTYSTVFNLKKGPLSHRRNPLEWKNIYLIFVGVWPLMATVAFLVVAFTTDTIQTTGMNGLNCDITHPLWPRVFGYAGAPFFLSCPCLVLSIVTARRIIQVSRSCPMARQSDPNRRISWLSKVSMNTRAPADPKLPSRAATRRKRLSNLGLPSHMSKGLEKNRSPDTEHRRLSRLSITKSITSSMLDSLAQTQTNDTSNVSPRDAHTDLPPSPTNSPTPSVHSRSETPSPIIFAAVRYNPQNPLLPPEPMALIHNLSFDPGAAIERGDDIFGPLPPLSPVSPSRERTSLELQDATIHGFHLPRRPNVGGPTRVTIRDMVDIDSKWTTIQEEDETDKDVHASTPSVDEPPKCVVHRVLGRPPAFGDEGRIGIMGLEDDPDVETAHLPPLFTGLSKGGVASFLGSPELTSALWRIILFQIAFTCITLLFGLTTWIDLANHPDTPSPFGTQHVALVLAGWGPFFVFGHIPAVRNEILHCIGLR